MWVEDVNEFSDFVKGLLVFLPLLVMLGPVSGSHDFPVYRMAQFNLHGVPHGENLYLLLSIEIHIRHGGI